MSPLVGRARVAGRVRVGLVLVTVLASACDRELERLEQDRTSAELRLAELERAGRALSARSSEALASWERGLDRRLPDLPRGALTASIAAALRAVPNVEIDGTPAPVTRGQVVTEPVIVHLPGGVEALATLLDRLAGIQRPWHLDEVTKDASAVHVTLHGFMFSGGSLDGDARFDLDPSHEEGTFFSKERDHVRRVTRAIVERAGALERDLERRGISRAARLAFRKAELKESIVADLDQAAQRQAEDVRLVVRTLVDARVTPLLLTFSVRSGRRLCTLRTDTLEAKNDVILVGTTRYGLAGDVKRTELTLPSGRVCTLGVGLPPR